MLPGQTRSPSFLIKTARVLIQYGYHEYDTATPDGKGGGQTGVVFSGEG